MIVNQPTEDNEPYQQPIVQSRGIVCKSDQSIEDIIILVNINAREEVLQLANTTFTVVDHTGELDSFEDEDSEMKLLSKEEH